MTGLQFASVFLVTALVLANPVAGEYDVASRSSVAPTSGAVPLTQSELTQDSSSGNSDSVRSSADNLRSSADILNTPVVKDALSGSKFDSAGGVAVPATGDSGAGRDQNLVAGGPVFVSDSGSDVSIDGDRNQQSVGSPSAETGNLVNISPSIQATPGGVQAAGNFGSGFVGVITVTEVITRDVFNTVSNLFYNSIPVTLTQFEKTTVLSPTLQVVTTPVDDRVFVATAPATRTDTKTVTDTRTAHQYATAVSTEIYTITHRAYDIQQQTVVSTLFQTQVFHPTVVRTRIDTNYDTQTVVRTVTHTVIVEPRTVSTILGGSEGQDTSFGQQQSGQIDQQQQGSLFDQQQAGQFGQRQQGSLFGQQTGQAGQQQVPQAVRQGQIGLQLTKIPKHSYH